VPRDFVGDVDDSGSDADEECCSGEDDDRQGNAVENERKKLRSRKM
jgi:hypothetical protein